MFYHEAQEAPLAACGLLCKGQERDTDIRINVGFIGMPMMPVMFIDPPAPTPTEHQIAGDKTGKFKQSPAAKDLSVANIMSNKPDLARDKGEKDRVEQLEPGVPENNEASDTESEQPIRKQNLVCIVGRLLLQ